MRLICCLRRLYCNALSLLDFPVVLIAVLVAVVAATVYISDGDATTLDEDDGLVFFLILLLITDAACLLATGRGVGVLFPIDDGDEEVEAMEILLGFVKEILESNIGAGDCKRKYSSSSSPTSDNSTSLFSVQSRIAE